MSENKTFMITTPIYYASGSLHIGHCYTTVAADAIARYKRQNGYDVYFLTGSDEHGQKVEREAAKLNKTPQAYVDEITDSFKHIWRLLNISYDGYVRTTDDYPKRPFKRYSRSCMIRATYINPVRRALLHTLRIVLA